MAFIPPEIGVGVKNRFTYSEIHTFQGGFFLAAALECQPWPLLASATHQFPMLSQSHCCSCGRYQHGDLVLTKRGKMAMDSSVPAKN
jgi:hypothetical protein